MMASPMQMRWVDDVFGTGVSSVNGKCIFWLHRLALPTQSFAYRFRPARKDHLISDDLRDLELVGRGIPEVILAANDRQGVNERVSSMRCSPSDHLPGNPERRLSLQLSL